MVKLQAFHKR